MHSYQHNIKTFNHATRHLTRVERSLYRDLIELYYDTEQPLPADNFERLCRLVLAHTDDEKLALQTVLDEFFVKTGDVFTHDYCDEQIDKYRLATTAKARAGKASAVARQARAEQRRNKRATEGKQPLNTCSAAVANQKQETRNQKPKDKYTQAAPACVPADDLIGEGVDPDDAISWLAARKAKRLPLTRAALEQVRREATKAGMTLAQAIGVAAGEGWAGFKADWLKRLDGGGSWLDKYRDRSWADGDFIAKHQDTSWRAGL